LPNKTTTKMKVFTSKTEIKFSPEFGKIEQKTFYLFGIKIMTENHLTTEDKIENNGGIWTVNDKSYSQMTTTERKVLAVYLENKKDTK